MKHLLTEWRKKNRIKRVTFAEMVGVKPITVYRWENYIKRPSEENLAKVYQITGKEIDANCFHEFVREK